MQAIDSARRDGHAGFAGVTREVSLPRKALLFSQVQILGGPAPVRRFLPELIQLIWDR